MDLFFGWMLYYTAVFSLSIYLVALYLRCSLLTKVCMFQSFLEGRNEGARDMEGIVETASGLEEDWDDIQTVRKLNSGV